MLKEPLTILWVAVRSERPENTPDNQKYSSWTSWRRRNKSGGSPDLTSPEGSLTLFLYQDGRKHTLTAPPLPKDKLEFTYIFYHSSLIIMVVCKHSPPPPHTHTQRKTLYPQLNSIHTFIVRGLEDRSALPPLLLQKNQIKSKILC